MKLSKKDIEVLAIILDKKDISHLSQENQKVISSLRSKLSGVGTIELFVDGAADLHSGTAGIGGVFYRNGEELYSFSEFIGSKTNNEAIELLGKLENWNIEHVYRDKNTRADALSKSGMEKGRE